MKNRDKEVARYLLDKYGSDRFKVVLEKIKQELQQQKESVQDDELTKKL
jgi:hypothetical protein